MGLVTDNLSFPVESSEAESGLKNIGKYFDMPNYKD